MGALTWILSPGRARPARGGVYWYPASSGNSRVSRSTEPEETAARVQPIVRPIEPEGKPKQETDPEQIEIK